ncbi:MAG TPA: DNA/RNA helicase domain-containing protein [Candidatus Didemnitutus sp.]|nr:DNA/RNA helicase domain-containing protein [Candidatus Didemnitutus sp.]
MIVYQASKRGFRDDVLANDIEDKIRAHFQEKMGHGVSGSEIAAWKNSLGFMDRVLESRLIPDDSGVAIEMTIPQSSKRMDFVLTGLNRGGGKVAVIVELKQWTSAKATRMDGVVETFLGGAQRCVNHPSYQAWSYASMLQDFNETVRDAPILLRPCAYLHNCDSRAEIADVFYSEHLSKAPAFLKGDALRLRDFIIEHVHHGDRGEILYEIVNGRIRPSKSLADKLASLLKGNREFVLIDDQKVVYESALRLATDGAADVKQTLIVRGGPGTGKSVVAINLLVELIARGLNVQYVTRNAAPRSVYEAKLTGEMKKSRISNLFRGSGGFHRSETNVFDVLLVDEAHRLNEKSGLYRNQGENQIKELIAASRATVFFIDEAQRIAFDDIGSEVAIRQWADRLKSKVTEAALESQFRCGGSDGYLAWVDNTLGTRPTANTTLEGIAYEVRVCQSATELRSLVRTKNTITGRARMVAGYCWPWKSKKDPGAMDIVLPEESFAAQWNFSDDGGLWIMKDHSVEQVGCIHTCQGLELDYVGVIIGHDLVIRNGQWVEFPDRRDKADRTIKGYYKLLLSDPVEAQRRMREIIHNTYRTLMTRALKGCFLYSVDPETNSYLRRAASRGAEPGAPPEFAADEATPFQTISGPDCVPYENCVPLFPDIQIAAGGFSAAIQADDCAWIRLPEPFVPRKGFFVVKVTGESMNRRIPNGSWCLFRSAPEGPRSGRIVLVQHRDIQDPYTGACTVKIYQSRKSATDDSWQHRAITLYPDSTDPTFRPIELRSNAEDAYRIIGELVAVISPP